MKPYDKEQAERAISIVAEQEIDRATASIQQAASATIERLRAEAGLHKTASSMADLFQAAAYVDCHDVNTDRCDRNADAHVAITWEMRFNGANVIPWSQGAPPRVPRGKYRVVLFVLPLEDK